MQPSSFKTFYCLPLFCNVPGMHRQKNTIESKVKTGHASFLAINLTRLQLYTHPSFAVRNFSKFYKAFCVFVNDEANPFPWSAIKSKPNEQ